MPQTILAVLALMITISFSLSTQRETIQAERAMITNELEVMATGIALEAMEKVRTRAFDASVVSDPEQVYTSGSFSYPFSTGRSCTIFDGSTACDDIDDFHDMQTATLEFELSPSMSMPFHVDVEVRYVDANMNPVNYATYWKEVTVHVQDVPQGDAAPFIRRPINMARIFAYNFGATKQGHGGRSQGHDQGEGNEEFEEFLEWFIDKLDGHHFRNWAEDVANDNGWHGLEQAIDDIGRNMNHHEQREIEDWLNDHPDVSQEILDRWYNRGSS